MSSNNSSTDSKHGQATKTWPPFNPFVRHPTTTQAKCIMIVTGSFLVPLRLVGAISVLSLGWIWAKIALIGLPTTTDPSEKPYSYRRHTIINFGFRILARLLLFCYGYIWIQTIKVQSIDDNKKETTKTGEKTAVTNKTHPT